MSQTKVTDNLRNTTALDAAKITTGTLPDARISDNAITLAKMASGTDGNIISYDASGNPVAIATGNDGQVLTSTGAGSPPAFEDAAGGGKVLQFVHAVKTDTFTTTATTSWVDITDMTVTTGALASTGSKVLVQVVITVSHYSNYTHYRVVDGSGSNITGFVGDAAGSRPQSSIGTWYRSTDGGGLIQDVRSCQLYHAANSTSAQTYKVQVYNNSNNFYLNRSHSDTNDTTTSRSVSTISAMEISS